MADQASKPAEQKTTTDRPRAAASAGGKFGAALVLVKAFKWPILGAASALAVLSGGSYWYFLHDRRPDPPVLLARALECLKDKDNAEGTIEARRIASELDALRYRDPEFGGAIPFILGIVEFRKAQLQSDRP